VLHDPGNMDVAVGIVLLSCVSAETCATEFSKPPSWISNSRLLTRRLLLLLKVKIIVEVSAHEYSAGSG